MLVLTPNELKDLTGKVQAHAQMRELAFMEIPFTEMPDGPPVVKRADLKPLMVRITRLYLIRSHGERRYLKIGISDNPHKRLKALQTGNPAKLELLADIIGCPEKERYLHRRFSHLRANGEWFKDRAEIRKVFGL